MRARVWQQFKRAAALAWVPLLVPLLWFFVILVGIVYLVRPDLLPRPSGPEMGRWSVVAGPYSDKTFCEEMAAEANDDLLVPQEHRISPEGRERWSLMFFCNYGQPSDDHPRSVVSGPYTDENFCEEIAAEANKDLIAPPEHLGPLPMGLRGGDPGAIFVCSPDRP